MIWGGLLVTGVSARVGGDFTRKKPCYLLVQQVRWRGVGKMFSALLKFMASLGVLFGLALVYLNFSKSETTYRCEGMTRYSKAFIEEYSGVGTLPDVIENPDTPLTGYLKVEEFSRLVLLWSDHRHYVWWEVPNETLMVWSDTRDLGQQLQLLSYKGDLEGTFSKISLSLSFITSTTEFTGACAIS